MNQETIALCKKLKVQMLTAAEIAALQQLQKEWKHWENREAQIMPLRIVEEQKAAYAAFLDKPTPENEQRLITLADTVLTGTRYALLRRAFADLRGRITKSAGDILHPFAERAHQALTVEHARRLEKAEPLMGSVRNNPIVKETVRAMDEMDRLRSAILSTRGGKSEKSPREIAEGLVPETAW